MKMISPGMTFGRLTAQRTDGRDKQGNTFWMCVCSCGTRCRVRAFALTSGHTQSCGCLQRENGVKSGRESRTHGHSFGPKRNRKVTRTYESYRKAKARTTNPDCAQWPEWGGRGVRFEFTSFEHFLTVMGERPPGTSLDRIDNLGNYAPGNCKWSSPKEQANNRRPRRWRRKPNDDPRS